MSQRAYKKFRKEVRKEIDEAWDKIVDRGLKLKFFDRLKFAVKIVFRQEKLLKKKNVRATS